MAEDTNAQYKRVKLFYQVVEYTAYVAFGGKYLKILSYYLYTFLYYYYFK